MLNPETMEEQKRAILKDHGATASHVESVRIREVLGRIPWWDGDVEVYEITGHPKAKLCYALSTPVPHRKQQHTRFVTLTARL
jgi:hypothetical protein